MRKVSISRALARTATLALVFAVGGPLAGAVAAPPPMQRLDSELQTFCPDVALAAADISVWTASGRAGSLARRLELARVAVLGEIHDNALHHRIQACLLAAFAAGRKPAVVWEQLALSQADALAAYLARGDRTAQGLGPAVGWENTGWPAWETYQPIAAVAFERGLAMSAGNADRALVMGVARAGLDAVPEADREGLKLTDPLPDGEAEALLGVLADSHCGLMPATAFAGMAKAQNLRDAWMARAVGAAVAEHSSAALITGNGHVHRFRGVPFYLMRQGIDAGDVLTVMVVETADPAVFAREAVPAGAGPNAGTWAADVVIATAPATREDPCVAMKKRFAKPK